LKAEQIWQKEKWREWSHESDWPAFLDVYESAAYLRVSHHTIHRAVARDRSGRATLPHQRIGSKIRIRRCDLERFGHVPGHNVPS
jgi:excisionase family DNA binding protein